MSAYLIVRAEVEKEADRQPFDQWYQDEHMPQATGLFKALDSRRGWSAVDPSVHFAFYRFPGRAAAEAIATSDEIKAMIAEFDRLWDGKVVRTRDIVEIAQVIES